MSGLRPGQGVQTAGEPAYMGVNLEVPEQVVGSLAAAVADTLEPRIRDLFTPRTPWMTRDEAIAYSRMRPEQFRKEVAAGRIRSHGRRSKRFHRAELDHDLGFRPADA